MIQKTIHLGDNQLTYFVFNEIGTSTLICFHGFGQKATDFGELADRHKKQRIIAINLFFHEKSYLNPAKPILPNDWKQYMNVILENESVEEFSIVGFSMGSRFALTTLALYPKMVNKIYLLAPDGLIEGSWYRFTTGNYVQRSLFKTVLSTYPTFLAIAKFLTKIGLLNKGLLKFAQIHLQTSEERTRVYNTWVYFRKLALSPKSLHSISTAYTIPIKVILGNFDRVIPISRIEPPLIKSDLLTVKKVDITHNKIFYYDFLDTD